MTLLEQHTLGLESAQQKTTIQHWLTESSLHWQALIEARKLNLSDWCLAAGFVRNLIWDRLHGRSDCTPLNDIDLIYFNPTDSTEATDRALEAELRQRSTFPWSVKNQARMHQRNHDAPYTSTEDAMSYWVEIETAVGAYLDADNQVRLVAPFGLEANVAGTITLNAKRPKPEVFRERIEQKGWLTHWPELNVVE
ncbi:hypothetical protein MED297_20302 [Reinekea sp. MED297]|uniref:Nitrate reductase n=2 Tax=Reinekea TaxID=230494 RepID=A4B9G5_9GAMM|nr:hypothetical protein MED297_20302 [Reinekea sp. MED297] [Reinekea blandensis MED297]